LKAAGIKILKAVPGTIADMVQKCKSGGLAELTEIHAGTHGRAVDAVNDQPGYHQH
jgi:predicted Fe-Mo cluster-binding NifX family protein